MSSVYISSVADVLGVRYTGSMQLRARDHFAKRVRECRAQRGWSQDDLAAASGLHRTYIGPVERAEHSITLDSVEKIARAFKVSISEMFEK